MLSKDKKPEVEEGGKTAKEVIPPRPDTPKMFKAALKVTEQVGIEGTFAKLRGACKPVDGSEVSYRRSSNTCWAVLCVCCDQEQSAFMRSRRV